MFTDILHRVENIFLFAVIYPYFPERKIGKATNHFCHSIYNLKAERAVISKHLSSKFKQIKSEHTYFPYTKPSSIHHGHPYQPFIQLVPQSQ